MAIKNQEQHSAMSAHGRMDVADDDPQEVLFLSLSPSSLSPSDLSSASRPLSVTLLSAIPFSSLSASFLYHPPSDLSSLSSGFACFEAAEWRRSGLCSLTEEGRMTYADAAAPTLLLFSPPPSSLRLLCVVQISSSLPLLKASFSFPSSFSPSLYFGSV